MGERTYEPFVPTVIGLLKCRNKGGLFRCWVLEGRRETNDKLGKVVGDFAEFLF